MFFSNNSPDDAARELTNFVLSKSNQHIPKKQVRNKPYKHPWFDSKCQQLLALKHASIGTTDYVAARDRCTEGFRDAQAAFLTTTRDKLRICSCKDWWKISKELLAKSAGSENIPPLKSGTTWAKDPASKAGMLASTFSAESQLPEPVANEYSVPQPASQTLGGFLRIRERDVVKILVSLDATSATGPDGLLALILNRC